MASRWIGRIAYPDATIARQRILDQPLGDRRFPFRDVLTRIAATPMSQLDQFLPDCWQASRQPTPAIE